MKHDARAAAVISDSGQYIIDGRASGQPPCRHHCAHCSCSY